MANAKTIDALRTEADDIRKEENEGANTASRVGTMFRDIIDYLENNLNTSSGSEDEGGSGGGGGGGGVSLNEPLFSINNMARTPGSGNKVLVCQNGVWDYGEYGGGSTTSGVTWDALAGNTNEQIRLSHLTTALGNCSFWGRNPVYDATSGHMTVSGDMINVGSITMRYNNDDSKSVKIEVDDRGNLKFNGNIYATGGVSALGNSSSGGGGGGGSTVIWKQIAGSDGEHIATITINGEPTKVYAPTSGGGGGATALEDLSDVLLSSSRLDGQYLRYDGSKWVNSTFSPVITALNAIPGGTNNRYLVSVTDGHWGLTEYREQSSGISVSIVDSDPGNSNAVVNARVSDNALTLTKGTVLTSLPVATKSILGGVIAGNNLDIDSSGKLSVNGNGLSVASAANAEQANRLSDDTTRKAWGQAYWQNGIPHTVSGDMTSVGSITMSGYIFMNNGTGISMKDTKDVTRTMIGFNSGNAFYLGYGARLANYQTDIQGGSSITFATSAVKGVGDSRRDVGGFTKAGQFYVEQGTEGIRIGNGIIKWDSTHDALYVVKDGGGVANFYASGGVSALGFSNGSTGSVTVADLTVENLAVDHITPNNGDEVYLGDEDSTTYISVNGDIEVQNALSTDTLKGFTWVSMLKLGTKTSTSTPSGNCLYVKKVNGVNKLYFYNGSSETPIA